VISNFAYILNKTFPIFRWVQAAPTSIGIAALKMIIGDDDECQVAFESVSQAVRRSTVKLRDRTRFLSAFVSDNFIVPTERFKR